MRTRLSALRSFALHPFVIFVAGLFLQSDLLGPLWNHSSTSTEFLGRYSLRYGAALILSAALTAGWIALVVFHRRAARLLQRLPERAIFALLGLAGVALIILWQLSVEIIIQYYLSVNFLLIVVVLALIRPDRAIVFRRWPYLIIAVVLALLIPLGISAVTRARFSPDEAHWADMATTFFVEGGVYSRTWYYPPC